MLTLLEAHSAYEEAVWRIKVAMHIVAGEDRTDAEVYRARILRRVCCGDGAEAATAGRFRRTLVLVARIADIATLHHPTIDQNSVVRIDPHPAVVVL